MNEGYLRAKKAYSQVGFALLVSGLAAYLLTFLAGVVTAAAGHRGEWASLSWIVSSVAMYGIGFSLAIWMIKRLPRANASGGGLGEKNLLSFFAICFPVMMGGNLLGNWLSDLLSGGQAENVVEALVVELSPLKVLMLVVVGPLLEEFLFRKQLIDHLSQYGEKTAILFSGIVFGLYHMNLFQFFYAMGIGLVLAYVYTRTRRLRDCVGIHVVLNFLGGVVAAVISQKMEALSALMEASEGLPEAEVMEIVGPLLPWATMGSVYSMGIIGLALLGLFELVSTLRKLTFAPAEVEIPRGRQLQMALLNPGALLLILACVAMCVWNLI